MRPSDGSPGRGLWLGLRLQPSLPAALFALCALLIPVFVGVYMVNADGDPARHVRHGETILAQGGVIRFDSFSFTRSGDPFVGFESGSQVVLALAHRLGGTAAMAVLAGVLIAATIALVAWWLLRKKVDYLLVILTTFLIATLTSIHWLARPHLVSWFLTAVLMMMLEARRSPPVWQFGLLFLVWANFHGGFLFGWIILAIYLAGELLERWGPFHGQRPLGAGRPPNPVYRAKVLGCAVAATFCTPYFWDLPAHVVQFFGEPYLRDHTNEFLSPNFHHPALYPFLFTLMGLLVVVRWQRKAPVSHDLLLIVNVAFALIAQRHIPLFALTSLPLLAVSLTPVWRATIGTPAAIGRAALVSRQGRTLPWVLATLSAAVLLGANRGRVGETTLVPDGFSRRAFPVDVVERARTGKVTGRIFHSFAWGGYLLYAWPEQQVFIDGGTDFYGTDLFRSFREVSGLQPGWRDSLSVWGIDLILLPPSSPLVAELLREDSWVPRACDSSAVFLSRNGHHGVTWDSVPRSSCNPTRPPSK